MRRTTVPFISTCLLFMIACLQTNHVCNTYYHVLTPRLDLAPCILTRAFSGTATTGSLPRTMQHAWCDGGPPYIRVLWLWHCRALAVIGAGSGPMGIECRGRIVRLYFISQARKKVV